MSIKVAVRVRPFNSREKDSKLIIDMQDTQTIIENPANGEKKVFNFDYSFWSHDGFIREEDGYLKPEPGGRYADQKYVFEVLGQEILDNAWEGYNCCLFAYGQTGSGKSYSMVGYGANEGIVPISCQKIFERIEQKQKEEPNIKYEVYVSMLEIYNEKIQDLLVSPNKRESQNLKIKEINKEYFVSGLTNLPVDNYESIARIMEKGNDNRTVASTNMNATSSRAHTIISIQLKVKRDGKPLRDSTINLVDLAGSERSKATGATGDRLKEGCKINQSLSTLGNVINALADSEKAKSKGKAKLPPFRDSVLTKILKGALSGNSKTVMICALSPSDMNYEETLSTLRYADRAKSIKTHAVINVNSNEAKIEQLEKENKALKAQLEEITKKMNLGTLNEADKANFLSLKEQFDDNEKEMTSMNKTFEERLRERQEQEREENYIKVDINKPHLVQLFEDIQLSYKKKYSLVELPVKVGKKSEIPTPAIILSGIGIKPNLAIFEKGKDNEIILKPRNPAGRSSIIINNEEIPMEGHVLKTGDKIIFGANEVMVYFETEEGQNIYKYNYENIVEEYNNALEEEDDDSLEYLNELDGSAKIKNMQEEMDKQKEKYEKELKELYNNKSLQGQAQMAQIQDKFKKKLKKLKKMKKRNVSDVINQSAHKIVHKSEMKEITYLNIYKKLLKFKDMLNLLQRNVSCDLIFTKNLLEHFDDPSSRLIPLIRVENYEIGCVDYWTHEIFENRYEILKDLLNNYLYNNLDISHIKIEDDPLYYTNNETLIGYSFFKLEPLAHLSSNISSVAIISNHGLVVGRLLMDIIPIDEQGNETSYIDDQKKLIGKNITFKVFIKECNNLPDNFNNNIKIEFCSFTDNTIYKTKAYNSNNDDVVIINEYFQMILEYVSQDDIDYLNSEKLCLKIYGLEETEKKGRNPIPSRELILKYKNNDYTDNSNISTNNNDNDNISNGNIIVNKTNDFDCIIT